MCRYPSAACCCVTCTPEPLHRTFQPSMTWVHPPSAAEAPIKAEVSGRDRAQYLEIRGRSRSLQPVSLDVLGTYLSSLYSTPHHMDGTDPGDKNATGVPRRFCLSACSRIERGLSQLLVYFFILFYFSFFWSLLVSPAHRLLQLHSKQKSRQSNNALSYSCKGNNKQRALRLYIIIR